MHKEWPETIRRPETRRGNFDIAILPPVSLATADIQQFCDGRIAPPIVIEVGLDYGAGHLAKDQDKLLHSCVPNGYLLHLTRVGRDHPRVVEIMNNPFNADGIVVKTAFARANGGERSVKFVNGQAIQEWHGR